MKKILALTAALAAAATLAACSSGSGGASHTSSGPQPCASLPADPHWETTLKQGEACTGADGSLILYAWIGCKDKTRLYQFDDGKTHYWGMSTGRLHRGSGGATFDDPYGKAYTACTTGSRS